MNRWGTSFSDPILEKNYEMKQQTTIRYPLFVLLSFTGVLIMVVSLAVQLSQNNFERASIYAGLFTYTAIQSYVIHRNRLYVNYGLLTIGVIYISICFTIVIPKLLATAMMESYILITAHGMIFSVQNLSFGIIQLIINSAIIYTYNSFQGNFASVHVMIGYFWINGVIVFCTFKLQQQTRSFYLLSQKDQKLHMLLDRVVTKKVIIFDFDQEQFKFRTIYANQLDLKKLLNYQKGSQSLSQYLYSRIKSSQYELNEGYNEIFTLKDNDKLSNVNFSEFYFEQKTFVIILNEIEQKETMKIATNKIRLYLTKNICLLGETLKSNLDSQILQCRLIFMQLIAVKESLYEEQQIFKQINLNKLIKVYWKIIQLGYIKNKFYFQADKIHYIDSIEPLLSLVLIEALLQFRKYAQSKCQIRKIGNFIEISITTLWIFHPQPSKYRKIALESILHEYKAIKNGIYQNYIQGYLIVIQTSNDN